MKRIGLFSLAVIGVLFLGLIAKNANGQALSNTPFGLGQLLTNPQIGFGTHPGKPIYSTQTNIFDKPTYAFNVPGTQAANAMCEIDGGPSLRTRIRRLCVAPGTAATGASTVLKVIRTSSAGAGTAVAATALGASDPQDPPYSGTVRGPGAAGTTAFEMYSATTMVLTTAAAFTSTAAVMQPTCFNYDDGLFKSPTFVGTTNGIAVTLSAAGTTPVANSQTCSGIFTEEAY